MAIYKGKIFCFFSCGSVLQCVKGFDQRHYAVIFLGIILASLYKTKNYATTTDSKTRSKIHGSLPPHREACYGSI
jgi:hypothetical protein